MLLPFKNTWTVSLFVAIMVSALVAMHTPRANGQAQSRVRPMVTSFVVGFAVTMGVLTFMATEDPYATAVQNMIQDPPGF